MMVLPSTLMDEERTAAKVSPEWFLLLASAWPTVAPIVVPLGTVTSVADGITLLVAAAVFAEGLAAVLFAATTLPEVLGAGFGAAVLGATGLAAAGLAIAFLAGTFGAGWFAASSVALLEQPATVKNAAAATA